MHAARHQAGEVRHVDQQQRANFICNRAHARKIENPRIGAAAADDELRLLAAGGLGEFVVVDDLGVLAHTVGGDTVELAGKIQLVSVCQMAAVRQIEAEDGIARLKDGHIGRRIGLRAGVRLHVGVFGAENLLGAVAGQVLDHVREFATTVVAFARIAFRVLIREDGACGLQHGAADEVLRRNHLQPLVLAGDFVSDGLGDGGVGLGECAN